MEKYIKTDRHRTSTSSHDSVFASTQSDRARVIYSAAFRRLQQKAQVFSLESNSAVRSRLTHSIEVSHIGRYIVASVLGEIDKSQLEESVKQYWRGNHLLIANIVETACLLHDIGNPPFGHFGEAAISKWAKSDTAKQALKAAGIQDPSNQLLADFAHFDGNPQGFRIVTKLQGEDGFYGLNLTYTQLAAFLKYVCCPQNRTAQDDNFNKKIGYFNSEEEVIYAAWERLEMVPKSRHPLGFLMEASDDISYCISDIEDGIEKQIISVDHFCSFVATKLRELKEQTNFDSLLGLESVSNEQWVDKLIAIAEDGESPVGRLIGFKTTFTNTMVEFVAKSYVSNYQQFIGNDYKQEIISKGTLGYCILLILKQYTGEYLFTSHDAECMELSGFAIIQGILEEYTKLLALSKTDFEHLFFGQQSDIKRKNLHIERRLFNRLPQKHRNAYIAAICNKPITKVTDREKMELYAQVAPKKEWHLRAHLVVDFISGMTDHFSMEVFQMLKGINAKSQ